MCYAIASSILGWAVCLFRNSLVIHDYDKLSSCYIHLSPVVLMLVERWFVEHKFVLVDKFNITFIGYYLL